MISENILFGVMVIGVLMLALWPGVRIQRTLKALFQRLVLHPKVRLYLNLDPLSPPASLRALTKLVGSWTSNTFVQSGGIGACNHIKREADELLEITEKITAAGEPVDESDKYELSLELADIQILLMDIAYTRKIDLTDATLLKHYINTLRKWGPPDEQGVQHHIEERIEDTIAPRSEEQSERLVKNLCHLGRAKLAAILAHPDPTIAAAIESVMEEQEPLES